MAKPVDILINDDFDLKVEKGDFAIGDANQQHQQLFLLSQKGMWKQDPKAGVGVMDFLLDDLGPEELRSSITEQFKADGMKINKLEVKSDYKITVDADYGS